MHFRSRLLLAVPGPVQALGYQLYGGGVNDVDGALEAVRKAGILAASVYERGMLCLYVSECAPEQLLRHCRVSRGVGVRQAVSARRGAVPALGQVA